jgi:glycerophosphoryl diester phosphodiesterase
MHNIFQNMKQLLTFDFKKLIVFEIFIRVFGIFVVYPLSKLGLFFAIKLSGFDYITNEVLAEFLFKPSTIIIFLLIVIFFSIYVCIEFVSLTVLFDSAYHQKKLSYKDFIFISLTKTFNVIKKYSIFIILPILIFFFIIELGQILFLSSTIKLPEDLVITISSFKYFSFSLFISTIILLVFFTESIFFVYELIINKKTLKESLKSKTKALKGQRFKFAIWFVLINALLTIIVFILYISSIYVLSLFIGAYRGEEVILSLILTSAYTIYWMISIFFSIIILPLNISYLSSYFYKINHITKESPAIISRQKINRFKENRWLIRLLIVTFLVFFSINIFSISRSVRSAHDQTQFLKQEEIVAHRGASYYAPENTLSAIELAIIQGADGVEFDIRETKDNVPILLHDETLIRTTNAISNKRVSDLTYEEISAYDAGSWFSEEFSSEKVPTFDQALQVIKGRTIAYIDIKTRNVIVEMEIVRLIEEYDMVGDVRIMSFNEEQLFRFKEYNPSLKTILLVGMTNTYIYPFLEDDRIDDFAINTDVIKNNPRLIDVIHRYDKKAYAWVVDDQKAVYLGMDADVDGFITKRPIVAREIAYSKNISNNFKELLDSLFKP